MPFPKPLIIFSLILLALALNSCKEKCYRCQYLRGEFKFYKAGDTVRAFAATPQSVQDTILYYTDNGYVCDTIDLTWENENVPICDKKTIEQYGLKCVEE